MRSVVSEPVDRIEMKRVTNASSSSHVLIILRRWCGSTLTRNSSVTSANYSGNITKKKTEQTNKTRFKSLLFVRSYGNWTYINSSRRRGRGGGGNDGRVQITIYTRGDRLWPHANSEKDVTPAFSAARARPAQVGLYLFFWPCSLVP